MVVIDNSSICKKNDIIQIILNSDHTFEFMKIHSLGLNLFKHKWTYLKLREEYSNVQWKASPKLKYFM